MAGERCLIVADVRVVDSDGQRTGDVYIEDGRYVHRRPAGAATIDGRGLLLLPALVDLHCHFRQPGHEYKEDFVSGSRAAVAGGYGFVTMMANTRPVINSWRQAADNEEQLRRAGLVDGRQAAAITEDLAGERLSPAMAEVSCWPPFRVVSDDGCGVEDDRLMAEAMAVAREKRAIVMSHAAYREMDGTDSRRSENAMIARDIRLSGELGSPVHLCHVSTAEGVEMAAAARRRGVAVSLEVTPHHLVLTDEVDFRVNPPLRSQRDRLALIAAVRGGVVDAIATDHAPHSEQDKRMGAPGLIGLETALVVCFTELVASGQLTMGRLVWLMAGGPARRLGLPDRR
ncbi:MAG: amidohydrolase family protein, partial [Negativicutes bacterium]|nr:amidohydrolase family protein [Negativicutes bacterium]